MPATFFYGTNDKIIIKMLLFVSIWRLALEPNTTISWCRLMFLKAFVTQPIDAQHLKYEYWMSDGLNN